MKITGPRSLQTKLRRLASELENDACRVRAEDGDTSLANSLLEIALRCGSLAKYLNEVAEDEGPHGSDKYRPGDIVSNKGADNDG